MIHRHITGDGHVLVMAVVTMSVRRLNYDVEMIYRMAKKYVTMEETMMIVMDVMLYVNLPTMQNVETQMDRRTMDRIIWTPIVSTSVR